MDMFFLRLIRDKPPPKRARIQDQPVRSSKNFSRPMTRVKELRGDPTACGAGELAKAARISAELPGLEEQS